MKTLNEQISTVIDQEPVAVFMKGTPQLVMCGNSHRALQALHAAGAPITAVDILPDPRIRQELASISRSLKILAKELNVPILALSQLSRAPEARGDHRPQLSDLRESGALEQDADVVLFIFREEMYASDGERSPEAEGTAEIIIGKQRNGPTGTVRLAFLKQYTRFENLSRGFADDREDAGL